MLASIFNRLEVPFVIDQPTYRLKFFGMGLSDKVVWAGDPTFLACEHMAYSNRTAKWLGNGMGGYNRD